MIEVSPVTSAAMPAPRRDRWLAMTALLGITVIWGLTFFMVKDVTSHFSVVAFLAIRFTIGTLGLLPFALRVGRRPTWQEIKWGVLAGIIYSLGFVLQTFSLRLIDSGRVGFLTGLYIVFVPLLGRIFLHQPIKPRVIVGVVLALIGLALLSYAPGGNLLGDMLGILCAVSYAGQILVISHFPKHTDWRLMAIIQAICVVISSTILLPTLAAFNHCAGPICTALAPFADTIPTAIPLDVLAVAAFTGLIATAAGLGIQVWAQRLMPASDAALILAMESPFSALFGVTLHGEILTLGSLIGSGLMLSGMITTTLSDAA